MALQQWLEGEIDTRLTAAIAAEAAARVRALLRISHLIDGASSALHTIHAALFQPAVERVEAACAPVSHENIDSFYDAVRRRRGSGKREREGKGSREEKKGGREEEGSGREEG